MNRRKKVAGMFWLPVLLFALALTGCGKTGGAQGENEYSQETGTGTNVVEIKKDGVISNTKRILKPRITERKRCCGNLCCGLRRTATYSSAAKRSR